MILRIDHIGLATGEPGGVGDFLSALGLSRAGEGTAEAYQVACEFWRFGDGPAIEIVSPTGADSTISGRLATAGPGLYHVAFEVDSVEAELKRLRGQGFSAVDVRPCSGALPGMSVAFMYARKPAGFLVELVEYANGEQERG